MLQLVLNVDNNGKAIEVHITATDYGVVLQAKTKTAPKVNRYSSLPPQIKSRVEEFALCESLKDQTMWDNYTLLNQLLHNTPLGVPNARQYKVLQQEVLSRMGSKAL